MSAQPKAAQTEEPEDRIGLAALTRHAFSGGNMAEIASQLLVASAKHPENTGVLMDLSIIEQIRGNTQTGLDYQRNAIIRKNLYRTGSTAQDRLKLLVLAAPIHMGGNTPVELLLEDANVEVLTVYIAPGLPVPETLPPHDLIMIAAPGDTGSIVSIMPGIQPKDYLEEIRSFLDGVTLPIINRAEPVFNLERDMLGDTLYNIKGVKVPYTNRVSNDQLQAQLSCEDLQAHQIDYPLVIRPVGSHAGFGLEMIRTAKGLRAYIEKYAFPEYFISELIDYRSRDGQFRKYRIMFVDGTPYPCHMAIGGSWKLWYMNAKMEECSIKRIEEAAFMIEFELAFGEQYKMELREIARRIELDYFGIDCAIDEFGKLVVFEADNAMIAHDMDPADIYPYKGPAMQKMFKAFETMLLERAGNAARKMSVPAPEASNNKRWVRIR